jgi:hypothetical protein
VIRLRPVESRKAWRNRDASAGEGVLALLEALRTGMGAQGVGLFDDDRADPDAPRADLNFWDAFDERPCTLIAWDSWYRDLRRDGRVTSRCGCGEAHHLCGFLIHGRWALLLVAPPALVSSGAAAIASSLRALAEKLPPARTAAEWDDIRRHEAPPAGTDDGPVWWVRKLRQ